MLQHTCSAPKQGGAALTKQASSRSTQQRNTRARWLWRLVMMGATLPVVPFLLWSCNSHPLQKPDPMPVGEQTQVREIKPIHKVDIVFVVDNSGSMQEEQANLTRNFGVFMRELNVPGADLHIAAVTSDLGAGATSYNPGCATGGGDKGTFCMQRGNDTCARCSIDVSQGRFLRTVNPNFPANTLQQTFTCMATFGTNGCGFEHSVGSLAAALNQQANGGFIREDAYLAFIVITDEDDCTGPADSQIFASMNPGQDASLRCALQGHTCGGARNDGTVEVDRPLSECQAGDGELVPLQRMIDQVLAVKKNDANMIISAGIFGWPLPGAEATARYQIRGGAGGFGDKSIRPVCNSNNGSATPAFRVKKFIEAFPNHSTFSICQNDFSEAMKQIGAKIRVVLGSPCIDAPLIDVKTGRVLAGGANNSQADCAVTEFRPRDGGGEDEVLLSRCEAGGTKACWNLVEDAACSISRYKVEIDRRSEPAVDGTRQTIRCLTQATRAN